jgi:hypothetical protein
MEEKMLKLLPVVCLLGVAGLMMVGGCTPEENKTWSESQDFSGDLNSDWSGYYSVYSTIDAGFTGINIYQSGSSLQGFDNLRRSWFGHITPGAAPTCNMEAKDSSGGAEVLAGSFELIPTLDPLVFELGCIGQHWTSSATGQFEMLGPFVTITPATP